MLIEELDITYHVGTTYDLNILQAYKIFGMPCTFFITPDGKVFRKWTGFITKDKLTEIIEELIQVS